MRSLPAITARQLRSGTLLFSRAVCSSRIARAERPSSEPAAGEHFKRVPVHDASTATPSHAAQGDDKPTKDDAVVGAKAGAIIGGIYGLIFGFIIEPLVEGAAAGTALGTLAGAAFGAVKMAPYAAEYRKEIAEGHFTPPKQPAKIKVPPKSDTTYWA